MSYQHRFFPEAKELPSAGEELVSLHLRIATTARTAEENPLSYGEVGVAMEMEDRGWSNLWPLGGPSQIPEEIGDDPASHAVFFTADWGHKDAGWALVEVGWDRIDEIRGLILGASWFEEVNYLALVVRRSQPEDPDDPDAIGESETAIYDKVIQEIEQLAPGLAYKVRLEGVLAIGC